MMFGYLFVRLSDRALKTHTPTWLALTVGLIPDADLYFGFLGLEHHTYTHSILFWLPLIPIVYYKRQYIPSFVGIVQHLFVLMVSLTLIYSNESNLQLVQYAFSSQKLSLISVGHVVVGAALATSVLQGLRASLIGTQQNEGTRIMPRGVSMTGNQRELQGDWDNHPLLISTGSNPTRPRDHNSNSKWRLQPSTAS
jgi:hypothetical protein